MSAGIVLLAAITILAGSCKNTVSQKQDNPIIIPPSEYTVTVDGGTGATGDGNYLTGATVSIDAGVMDGKAFKEWICDSAGVVFDNVNSAATTFIMPANPVAVKASFYTLSGPAIVPLNITLNTGSGNYEITGDDWNLIKTQANGAATLKVYCNLKNAFDRYDAGWVNVSDPWGGPSFFGLSHLTNIVQMSCPVVPTVPYWTITIPIATAKAGLNNQGQLFAIYFNTAMEVYGVKAELIIGNGGSDIPYAGDPNTYAITGNYHKPKPANPNFHIYLAIGQSNMQGDSVAPVNQDIPYGFSVWFDSRFQFMDTMGPYRHQNYTKGTWYLAKPPTFMDGMGLNPCDNFGRTLVAMTTSNISFGTINCACSGMPLAIYDKTQFTQVVNNSAFDSGQYNLAYSYAMEYPYKALVDYARAAQKLGVIKGIIMLQGEAGAYQSATSIQGYDTIVKDIYNDLKADLDLENDDFQYVAGTPRMGTENGNIWGAPVVDILFQLEKDNAWFHVVDLRDFENYDTNTTLYIDPSLDISHYTVAGRIEAGRRFAVEMYNLVYAKK